MADFVKKFETTQEYNTYMADDPLLPNVSLTADDYVVHFNELPDFSKQYLTFEALETGTFTLTIPSYVKTTYMTSVSYSTDNGETWTTTNNTNSKLTITTPTVNAGGKVLWKGIGKATTACPSNSTASKYCSIFTSTGRFNISGNIMSLLYGDNFQNQTTFPDTKIYTFVRLFEAANIKHTKYLSLPVTTFNQGCYQCMFKDCTALISLPKLTATTLGISCYNSMFQNCTNLTTIPSDYLPATTLAHHCYSHMFNGCTSLTTVPELPVTSFIEDYHHCYQYMFANCTSLATAPELPATTLISQCYYRMFQNCSNLNNVTMLATDITATDCLLEWLYGVAATGTFTKAASMTTLPEGASGIPSGWTVQDN